MKILLVTDQYFSANNGMTISSRRFAKVLRDHGHEVRIVSTDTKEGVAPAPDAYLMRKQYIPIFDNLVTAQCMIFSKPDDALLEEAISWADVTHFLLPFAMGACEALGGNVITDAFGVVAMVAMTPLLTIQLLGLFYQWKLKRTAPEKSPEIVTDEEIIDL